VTDWNRLRGQRVRVMASGFAYRGIVVELGEGALVLRTETGIQEIPWERISQVTEEA